MVWEHYFWIAFNNFKLNQNYTKVYVRQVSKQTLLLMATGFD